MNQKKGGIYKMTESLINNLYEKNIDGNDLKLNKKSVILDKFIMILSFYRLKHSAKKIDYSKFVVKNKDICNGKPTIKGTRITTEAIFNTLLKKITNNKKNENYLEEIKKEYPTIINDKQIMAALLYHISHISYKEFYR